MCFYCVGSSVTLTANGSANTFQWKLNNQKIAGANANTYQASQAGVYTVVNSSSSCRDSASLLAIEWQRPSKPNININGDTLTSTVTAAQYHWYLNGNNIPSANAQSYVASQDGLYRVKVSNSFGCSDSSLDYTFVKSGIAEMGRDDIKLYPNPTSSYALLELANEALWQVQISDVSGKNLRTYKPFKGKELTIQKDELKAGAYLVHIKNTDNNKSSVMKLIIE
ncbi:MAG: T9SS type A sorting domain-containing protein [Bacteroidetes bacterium]|nr:T9SS type A sorting domain-containing protein [Bacteroidota bacterium]